MEVAMKNFKVLVSQTVTQTKVVNVSVEDNEGADDAKKKAIMETGIVGENVEGWDYFSDNDMVFIDSYCEVD
jgi:hypothetical protein